MCACCGVSSSMKRLRMPRASRPLNTRVSAVYRACGLNSRSGQPGCCSRIGAGYGPRKCLRMLLVTVFTSGVSRLPGAPSSYPSSPQCQFIEPVANTPAPLGAV